jgi:hypothetical protein
MVKTVKKYSFKSFETFVDANVVVAVVVAVVVVIAVKILT